MIKTAVINQKGGVGKTTTTVNLGAALAQLGKRVLLLDMDPQANMTLHLDRLPDMEAKTMTSLMVDDAPLHEMVVPTASENLFLVPADTSLSGVEQVLANRIGRETILREALQAYAQLDQDGQPAFDFVLMDCPPALGVLSANALVCADEVIVPMQAEYFSLQGMAKLMEVMELVKNRLNPVLTPAIILPCMVDLRTNLSSEVLHELKQHFGPILSDTYVRSNVKLAEAPSFGRTIFEHAPDSNGAKDYLKIATNYLSRHLEQVPAADAEVETETPAETVTPAEVEVKVVPTEEAVSAAEEGPEPDPVPETNPAPEAESEASA